MRIGSKELHPKIKISVIGRYASSRGISLTRIEQLLSDMTMDDLVGLFVFACEASGTPVTVNEVYDEIDNRPESLGEIANLISEQLGGGEQQPERSGRKVKK
jgi:hypothetical protein